MGNEERMKSIDFWVHANITNVFYNSRGVILYCFGGNNWCKNRVEMPQKEWVFKKSVLGASLWKSAMVRHK